ncbi:MAG: CofH family radical SAM protein [Thermodesulfovibrionales bacterium]
MKNKKPGSQRLQDSQALALLQGADLLEVGQRADDMRRRLHPEGITTFIVDRNINYTNVCVNQCTFCAFWRDKAAADAYVLSEADLFRKIEETLALDGTQILLQGGLHPDLGIDYYIRLLRSIKSRFPIAIHGFSPPEICYIADSADLTLREALRVLREAGLDSIPGGGAEILSDRVREILSPKKIRSSRWLEVMEAAHGLGMRTTATMMFGSIESPEDIVTHLRAVRDLQDRTGGFTAFIPWSFQPGNTELEKRSALSTQRSERKRLPGQKIRHKTVQSPATAVEYLKVLAVSRLYLDNVPNIQASWVTQGLKLAQVALRFGANDFGSTMIEENVVASTGVSYRVTKDDIINAIRSAGFIPAQRDTCYTVLKRY